MKREEHQMKVFNRRDFISAVALGSCASALAGCATNGRARLTPPNVLFISVDDLNDWIGPLGGHPLIQS